MRVRQLLQREPFGDILERTLERYWSGRHGQTFKVQWGPGETGTSGDTQVWWGNWHLNYFATAATPAECYDIVHRQYGRSISIWQRPWQYLYVRAGTSRSLRTVLSQVAFRASPASPDGGKCLVMGGNHRLHLVDTRGGWCTVVLKDGFEREYTENELAFRKQGSLPFIPRLLEVAPDGSWFTEQYIKGLGAARLRPSRAAEVVDEAARQLAVQVVGPSLKAVRMEEWGRKLVQDVHHRLNLWSGQPWGYRRDMEELAGWLGRLGGGSNAQGAELGVAWSHGDFQRGNIMDDGTGVWIIDWESVAQRSAGYDPLTLTAGSRGPGRLRAKLQALLQDAVHPAQRLLAGWPGVDWTPPARRSTLAIYLLEELVFHLRENGDPMFYDAAASFRGYFDEIAEAGTLLQ